MNSKKVITISVHVIAWAIFLSLPFLLFSTPPSGEQHTVNRPEFFGIAEILSSLLYIGFFYVNAYSLIPALLSKKKTITYVIIIIILILFIAFINSILSEYYRPHFPPRPFIRLFIFKIFPC